MVRVLTRFRGPELAFGAWLLTAATVAACGGKALNVGSEEQKGGAGGGVGGYGAQGGRVCQKGGGGQGGGVQSNDWWAPGQRRFGGQSVRAADVVTPGPGRHSMAG